jgi:hypothetical protein
VTFECGEQRQDLVLHNPALTDMIISYNGQEAKRWQFRYGYFESTIKNPDALKSYDNYRLKLREIEEITIYPTINLYNFSYYGENAGESQMPFKTSYAGDDYWGFLNSSNVTQMDCINYRNLFPNESSIDFVYTDPVSLYSYNYQVAFTQGRNKLPDLACAKAYTLKTITYNTGASTTFDYELNDYSRFGSYTGMLDWVVSDTKKELCGGLRIKSITDKDSNGKSYKKDYSYICDIDKCGDDNYSSGLLINKVKSIQERGTYFCRFQDGSQSSNLVKYVALSSRPFSSIYSADGEAIVYSQVNVKDSTGTISYYYDDNDAIVYFDAYVADRYSVFAGTEQGTLSSLASPYSPTVTDELGDYANGVTGYVSNSYNKGLLDRIAYTMVR